jgi:hypothetical protein
MYCRSLVASNLDLVEEGYARKIAPKIFGGTTVLQALKGIL